MIFYIPKKSVGATKSAAKTPPSWKHPKRGRVRFRHLASQTTERYFWENYRWCITTFALAPRRRRPGSAGRG